MASTSSASMSRSRTAREETAGSADALLRASLSGSALPSPSSASVSRLRAARAEASSAADELLHSSLSGRNLSSASAASVSRTRTPPDETSSEADKMLHSSLSGTALASTSSASVSRSKAPDNTKANTGAKIRSSLAYSRGIPPEASSVTTNTPPPLYASKLTVRPAPISGKAGASTPVDSAELRKLRFNREVERANASAKPRKTAGIFEAACSVDLLFLIDTTYSMSPYIEAAKQQVRNIVGDIKAAFLNESQVRIAVVSYKDHCTSPNIQYLDFTTSAEDVRRFLDTLTAENGGDFPEDVLGGIQQAIFASWKQQTRSIIHIGDAPPHGSSMHDYGASWDDYYVEGSEPHGLTYQPLIRRLLQLKINYAFCQIGPYTDRMAYNFASMYGARNTKLLPTNAHYYEMERNRGGTSAFASGSGHSATEPQFEELKLGTSYHELRHLVVRSVTSSVSRTAGRLSVALAKESDPSGRRISSNLGSITESEDSILVSGTSSRRTATTLETSPPRWDSPGWLDDMLEVEGFCPAIVVHSADTLGDMMYADKNIHLSPTELTVYARSKSFAKGAMRAASYARTAASTNRYVVKSFLAAGHIWADVAEDMRIQALCKAFALEFNGLLTVEPPLDFIVTFCLQRKSTTSSESERECLSLEPYVEGRYIKYNTNCAYVNEDTLSDPFGQMAQAFSHFTFERSWGRFLVNDLQGVGRTLTDPSIQAKDPERFKLNDTNLGKEGFKFFFATHKCNDYCQKLELQSNARMFETSEWKFRESWPTMDPTVCCSNKLCRRIIRLANAHDSGKFPGQHWCDGCWSQLDGSLVSWVCAEPGPNHEFEVSRFYHESQGELAPKKCPDHREKKTTASSAAAVGGSLWTKKKTMESKGTIHSKRW